MRNRKVVRAIVSLAMIGTFVLALQTAGMPIAVASCMVFLLSAFLVKRSCYVLDLRRISVTSFWYLTYLAMIFFPSFVIYYNQDGHYRDVYLFAVESVLITVPLGWLWADWLWDFNRVEIDRFYQLPIVEAVGENRLSRRVWILLLFCMILVVAYIREVRTIPLLYLLRHPGEAAELALLREEAFKLLDSRLEYFYYLARQVFFPLLILVALGAYLEVRSRGWFFTLAIAGTTGLAFAAFSLAKAPVALIFLAGGIFYYLYKQGQPSRKIVAALLILIFLFPVVVITYATSVSSADSGTTWLVAAAIGSRLFYVPAEVLYYYFEVFPKHIPYLHGRGTEKLAKLLGVPYFDTPNAVGVYAYPQGLESISANAAFVADLNADFGLWGVLLGGLLAGGIMQSMQVYVLRRTKTITTLAMFSFLMVVFWFLNSTSLPTVLASDGAVLALAAGLYFDRPQYGRLVRAPA